MRNVRPQHVMAPSMPTGLLVLAMLVGQVAGFAKVPKDAAEKGGDLLEARTAGERRGAPGGRQGPEAHVRAGAQHLRHRGAYRRRSRYRTDSRRPLLSLEG